MRVAILHRTNAHWESGATAPPKLVERVGAMIGAMSEAGVFEDGQGLRPSSLGARLEADGQVTLGPLVGRNETPAGFAIVRVAGRDEALAWAKRLASALGTAEVDVRPLTEPWDIGAGEKPEGLTTQRWMLLHKAPGGDASRLRGLYDTMRSEGVLITSEVFRPVATARSLRRGRKPVDGPFAESKELVGGYVIVKVDHLDDAIGWGVRYIDAVGVPEVDILPLS